MSILDERIFLSPFEVRLILNVSRSYVYRLVRDKTLKATTEKPIRIYVDSMKDHLKRLEPTV